MPRIELLHRSALCPAVALLNEIGAPTAALLRDEKLPTLGYDEPTGFVPTFSVWSFLDSSARSQEIPDIGFRIADTVGIHRAARWGPKVVRAPTLRHAISAMRTHVRADMPNVEIALSIRGEKAWFQRRHDTECRDLPGYDLGEQYILGLMIQMVRLVEGASWRPRNVSVQAKASQWRGPRPEFLREARIDFEAAWTAFELTRSALRRRLPPPPASPPVLAGPHAGELPAGDFPGTLYQALAPLVYERDLPIELGTEFLSMSERSLRRRLTSEGTSWRRIVDRVRCDTALDLMEDPALSLMDIALEVGYSQQAHFTRAFRRWTGWTPSAYRRQQSRATA
jgi:AraC-like DNA-binding protein